MVATATLDPRAAITKAMTKAKISVDELTEVCNVVNVLLNPPKRSPPGRANCPPDGE